MTVTSWVPVPAGSDFPVTNLPYGVFEPAGGPARVGVAIGEHVLDLAAVLDEETFAQPSLNTFMAQGRERWQQTRARVTDLLTDEAHRSEVEPALYRLGDVRLLLPFSVADYVDFYASEQHASNIGRMFRPDSPPLMPNWKHLPVGYHGRAGTVVASDTPIVRPSGQRKPPQAEAPMFGPSQRLDIEAEVGFVVGAGSDLGTAVSTEDFAEHVFGVCLVNDWSARDIQAWEYVPLGPFLGKSFATSVSPWIVPLEALQQARVSTPEQDPQPLPYLREKQPWGLDLDLEVSLNDEVIARPPFDALYWSPAQQLAHMTINGACLRTGDFYASGTVSGSEPDQRGSLIELSWNGENPLTLKDGSQRVFLADGDTVTIRATAPGAEGTRIGFGEVTGTIHPAREELS
ncbi:fumarylacetoacetate hydrolase [Halopolyspora algeriensis]|uniref:fumarylacetoacetase n=1 Tax=Halopolyspora algeriensis TaxID=1500506 RepID=A0A368VVQ0_9ACTN|nr:fumarylacetoacetase [Halopolyspora algeriensis]RCW45919.1 fumarylacetoacetate hydrolase [Halopolyspora algeriensis]TQM55332.1 fumarylacetoacetate hydrolase [Halopolyspora algeriensis]